MIKKFDNVFTHATRESLYAQIANSKFSIGWGDTNTIEKAHQVYFHCFYNEEDQKILQFFENIHNEELLELINGRKPSTMVVNCSKSYEVFEPHTHLNQDILLYYVNMNWKREWFGETLFYNEDCSEIVSAQSYIPGRVIWFKGDIPHTIRPSSSEAPNFRFSLSCVFDRRVNDNNL